LLFVVISELTGVESAYKIPVVLWDRLADIQEINHQVLINAINYTKKGIISVCMEIKSGDIGNDSKEIIVIVKDSGNGINPDIFQRLFSKFATNSPKGTG